MHSRIHGSALPFEPVEFREDVRRLFLELERSAGDMSITGECAPALDVLETDETIEVAMDLPGVQPAAVRVVARGQAILIVGLKTPRRARPDASFHLVERGYGRFARAVRLSSPCDTSRARATLEQGELRISIPRMVERRGRPVPITVVGESPSR